MTKPSHVRRIFEEVSPTSVLHFRGRWRVKEPSNVRIRSKRVARPCSQKRRTTSGVWKRSMTPNRNACPWILHRSRNQSPGCKGSSSSLIRSPRALKPAGRLDNVPASINCRSAAVAGQHRHPCGVRLWWWHLADGSDDQDCQSYDPRRPSRRYSTAGFHARWSGAGGTRPARPAFHTGCTGPIYGGTVYLDRRL